MTRIRFVSQGRVNNNLRQDRSAGPKALDHKHCTTNNLLIARSLFESPNCCVSYRVKAFYPTHTINIAHIT